MDTKVCQIKSIKKVTDKHKRYDITVNRTHNFFANGILVHNSLISAYHDGNAWEASTRKMAFAEGANKWGDTFRSVIETAFGEDVNSFFSKFGEDINKEWTLIFELCSPLTRVVKRYTETKMVLLAIRNKVTGVELSKEEVDSVAKRIGVPRPKFYTFQTFDDILMSHQNLPGTDEGYILQNGDWRLKVKNPSYLAWAHMRGNGDINPKRIAILVLAQDHEEYLNEFEDDIPFFEPYLKAYDQMVIDIKELEEKTKHLMNVGVETTANKKEFAMMVKDTPIAPIMFRRKKGHSLDRILTTMTDPSKLRLMERYINLQEK